MKFTAPKPEDVSESDHQKRCVEYANAAGFGHLLICIPNGTQLAGNAAARARYMASLKAMGLRPGASDLFLAKPVQRDHVKWGTDGWYHGAWFEMKRVDGRNATPEQVAFLVHMSQENYYTDVCFGFDQWVRSVIKYLAGKPSPVVRIKL